MPKMKTHRAAAKRYKVTASGKNSQTFGRYKTLASTQIRQQKKKIVRNDRSFCNKSGFDFQGITLQEVFKIGKRLNNESKTR